MGGHIGYGVRPSERLKGNATEILRLMLAEAKKRNMFKILVGVYETNTASRRVVEKCNGVLENMVSDSEHPEKLICRYWIDNHQ